LVSHNRTISLDDDTVVLAILYDLALLGPGMELELVDVRGPDGGELAQALDVADAEVADAYGAGVVRGVEAFEGEPHLLAGGGAAVGAVDEEEVDVARGGGVEFLDTGEAGGVGGVDGAGGGEDLGGEEDVAAGGGWSRGGADGFADFGFVFVELGCVEVTVLMNEVSEGILRCWDGRLAPAARAAWQDRTQTSRGDLYTPKPRRGMAPPGRGIVSSIDLGEAIFRTRDW
jgi:hypothetical protein